jgi:hypothetical protein
MNKCRIFVRAEEEQSAFLSLTETDLAVQVDVC